MTSSTTVVPSGTRKRSTRPGRVRGRGRASSRRSRLGRLRPLLDLLGRQVAVVRQAGGEQPLGGGDVGVGVGALEVRPLERRVVGADADPRQRVDDALRPLRPGCALVGVLDAQHERAARAASRSAQLYSAVRAPPTWKKPVGDGAKR